MSRACQAQRMLLLITPAPQHNAKGWGPASALQTDQVKEKTEPGQIYTVSLVWRNCHLYWLL